ncbi:MAG TPA: hypothetical protein VIN56_05450 [Candidatus Dormibacteraeota bacterium]
MVIEPGIIRTRFGETANASAGGVEQRPDGPYAKLNDAAQKAIEQAYEGWMSRFAGDADKVARVIERSISSARPRTRYVVTMGARSMILARRLLPDRAFDALLGSQFPTPR